MYLKIFLNSLLILFLFIFQVSFISALPGYFSNINILLIFLVYLLMISNLTIALAYAIVLGALMDIFSFYFFGSYLSGFIFSIIIVNFLLINFFTNRSLYTFLALIISASILSFFFVAVVNNIFSVFSGDFLILFNKEFFISAMKQLILNSIFMILIFYLTNFLNNSFKPVFLMNRKS
jgi:cell shape-determining protein MreD